MELPARVLKKIRNTQELKKERFLLGQNKTKCANFRGSLRKRGLYSSTILAFCLVLSCPIKSVLFNHLCVFERFLI